MTEQQQGSSTKMRAMDAIREHTTCACSSAYLIGRLISSLDTSTLVDLVEELDEWHEAHAENCHQHHPVDPLG